MKLKNTEGEMKDEVVEEEEGKLIVYRIFFCFFIFKCERNLFSIFYFFVFWPVFSKSPSLSLAKKITIEQRIVQV